MPGKHQPRFGRQARAKALRTEHLGAGAPAEQPMHEIVLAPHGVNKDRLRGVPLFTHKCEWLALAHPALHRRMETHPHLWRISLPILRVAGHGMSLAERETLVENGAAVDAVESEQPRP